MAIPGLQSRSQSAPPQRDAKIAVQNPVVSIAPEEEEDSGRNEHFEDIFWAISRSKVKLWEQLARQAAVERRLHSEAKRAAKRPPPPSSGGPFRPTGANRPFSACGPLFVPYYEPLKEQALSRPARCSDNSHTPAFKPGDAVPRIFAAEPPPLPACQRRPPFPGYPGNGKPVLTKSQARQVVGVDSDGAGPSRRASSARGSYGRPKAVPVVDPASPQASSSNVSPAPPSASTTPMPIMTGGRGATATPRTPRVGSALASRLQSKGVSATRTPPPWLPGRATPSDMKPMVFLDQRVERPKTSML